MKLPFFHSSDSSKRLSLGRLVNQSTALLMVSIGTLILLLALLILFYENANATKGYRLRNLENDRNESTLEQEVLNMQIAEAQALDHLRNDAQISAMVPAKILRYVNDVDAPVSSSSARTQH